MVTPPHSHTKQIIFIFTFFIFIFIFFIFIFMFNLFSLKDIKSISNTYKWAAFRYAATSLISFRHALSILSILMLFYVDMYRERKRERERYLGECVFVCFGTHFLRSKNFKKRKEKKRRREEKKRRREEKKRRRRERDQQGST